MMKSAVFLTVLLLLLLPVVSAQEMAVVPDVTGMTLPSAAAALNRAGIGIGQETDERWTEESGLPRNAISAQSIEPGTQVAAGSTIDLTVLRSPNALLLYDDNDLTLVNQTGGTVDLSGISFRALDGNQASFAASRWGGALRENRCAQIWSVSRNGPKGLDECEYIEHWLSTGNGGEHFWTGAGGTTWFALLQGGVERAVCEVASPGRCEFFLPGGGGPGADVTGHVYFAYTEDRLSIINNTEDRWMPLAGVLVRNNFAQPVGAAVNIADPSLFGSNLSPVANVQQLAPGQCILFTNSSPDAQNPPQPCDVVARLDIGASVIFWGAEFPVEGTTDDQPHMCPSATPGQLTLCIMPR